MNKGPYEKRKMKQKENGKSKEKKKWGKEQGNLKGKCIRGFSPSREFTMNSLFK